MTREPGATVRTTGGRVQGVIEGEFEHWRGIPYASPPVGPRRFRGPGAVEPWKDVKSAVDFGPGPWQTPLSRSARRFPQGPGVSEDCLTVNVSRRVSHDQGLPVIVFIYGGGNRTGKSSQYPGERLVGNGEVVAVTFNFRVGVMGFLDVAGVSGGEEFDSNLALRDQLAALRWVKDNIAEFGGNPDNVTIYGQSAGALAVTTLLATPSAEGLFARAVSASSPAFHVYSRDRVRGWTEDYLALLGLTPHSDLSELTRLPAETLITAAMTFDRRTRKDTAGTISMSYVVDGDLLPETPISAFRGGRAHRVPLMIGTCRDEHKMFTKLIKGELANSPAEIEKLFAGSPSEALERVRTAYSTNGRFDRGRVGGDAAFWYPSVAVAEAHSQFAPTRMFRVDQGPRVLTMLGLGATHGSDIVLVFGQTDGIDKLLGAARTDKVIAENLRADLVTFARGEDETWPLYEVSERLTGVYTKERAMVSDPESDRRVAWSGFVGYV
ncbi:carboxylesterase/lipase family protein [Agreia sp. VKM Ac-1783]|uniref:carboxylesterase/lipase family protein n=1 Tax=Agreia sp. VKM Ac-1783 TaxID=1938889 RepID=UPI000A2AED7A|nr:carboxylesterase/lipase family protein [Agreia sp. VKM Ac-1783]SMQ74783.1 para-nitrobenzyl esterase [Agreia sp. VKM Ac-1783]